LELRSPSEAFLLSGKVACELNDSARGFRLLTPGLTVVNQGNSFGVKVTELSPAEKGEFQRVLKPVYDKWAKTVGADLVKIAEDSVARRG